MAARLSAGSKSRTKRSAARYRSYASDHLRGRFQARCGELQPRSGCPRSFAEQLGQRLPHPLATGDPSERAQQIVESMAESLTQALRAKGMTAERLRDQNLPREGWLVQGYFTEVDEGNRLKRAAFGFGRGATSMNLQGAISDLARSDPRAAFGGLRHRKRPEPDSWSIGDDQSVCRGGKVRATKKCDVTRCHANRRADRRRDREIRTTDQVMSTRSPMDRSFLSFYKPWFM